MKIGTNAPQMYQYPLRIKENEDDDVNLTMKKYSLHEMEKVVDREKKKIEMLIGKFLHSGFNLWTEQQISESLFLDTKILGKKVQLMIDAEGEFIINTADINNPDRATCISMSQILNLIVKQAMSETGMIQLGRHPRFFNHNDPLNVEEMDI